MNVEKGAIPMATTTILGVFSSSDTARRALDELKSSGLHLHDTSLLAQGEHGHETLNAPEGALLGAAWGGLVGLAALAIPGIGPFVAGGAIAAALTGAATGAVVGGIGGALMHSNNLSEEDAKRYESHAQAGKTLVIVKADETDALEVRRILAHDGADSIRENETDMLHGGGIQVDMYDEGGRRVNSPFGEVVDIEPVPGSLRPEPLVQYNGTLVSERESALKDTELAGEVPPTPGASGEATSFDTEDIPKTAETMANGARVVSYEEENKNKVEPSENKPEK